MTHARQVVEQDGGSRRKPSTYPMFKTVFRCELNIDDLIGLTTIYETFTLTKNISHVRIMCRKSQNWLLRMPLRTPIVMPRTTYPPLLLLVLFASALFRIAEACSSRSTPKPRPPTATMRPNITFQTYTCPEDYAKWYCLNGATCFFVRIGESILYNCECADGFVGQRCEFKDLAGSYLPVRKSIMIERASIAGGVSLAVVIIVVISIVIYVYVRRREKEKLMIEELERKPFGSHSTSERQTTPTNDLESGSQPGTSTETPLKSLPALTLISQGRNQ